MVQLTSVLLLHCNCHQWVAVVCGKNLVLNTPSVKQRCALSIYLSFIIKAKLGWCRFPEL